MGTPHKFNFPIKKCKDPLKKSKYQLKHAKKFRVFNAKIKKRDRERKDSINDRARD